MILKYIGGLALAAVLLGAAAWHYSEVSKARAEVKAAWDTEKLRAIAAARIEDARRISAQEEIVHDANQKVQSAIADAAAARDASERLRKRFAAAVAAGRCPAAGTVDTSTPAGETVDLPSVVFGVLQDHAGQLAEYADRARIAGEACVKSYDSLRER